MKKDIVWGISLGQLVSAIFLIVISAGVLNQGEEAIRRSFLSSLGFMITVVGATLSMWELLRAPCARRNENTVRTLSAPLTDFLLKQVAEIIAIVHIAFYREDAEDTSNIICATCGGLSSKVGSDELSLIIVRSHTGDCLIGELENTINDFASTLVQLYQVVRHY